MIPMNAEEADHLIRCRVAEIARSEQQIEHFGRLQQVERARLERLMAEVEHISLRFPAPSLTPASES